MKRHSVSAGFTVVLLLVSWFGVTDPAGAVLTVLPEHDADTVIATVYENGKFGSIEERRSLVLKEGTNKLRFGWDGRKIDPSSLELTFAGSSKALHVKETSFPSDRRTVVWNVEAQRRVRATAVVTYLFTGVSLEPTYNLSLDQRSDTARILGRFKLANETDDTLELTRLRVLLGDVNLLDSIEEIIRAWQSQGTQRHDRARPQAASDRVREAKTVMMASRQRTGSSSRVTSDYHLMDLEGPITLPSESTTYIPFISRSSVDYRPVYRFSVDGKTTSGKKSIVLPNTTRNGMGETVIPGGSVNVQVDNRRGAPAWETSTNLAYTAQSDSVTLSLLNPRKVVVEQKPTQREKKEFDFDTDRTLRGWRERRSEELTVRNYRKRSVRVKLTRRFGGPYWTLVEATHPYTKTGPDRVEFSVTVKPRSEVRVSHTFELPFGSLR